MRTIEEIDREIAALEKQLAECKGRDCEVYSRIVGYYRAISRWNDGRVAEYKLRKNFEIKEQQ